MQECIKVSATKGKTCANRLDPFSSFLISIIWTNYNMHALCIIHQVTSFYYYHHGKNRYFLLLKLLKIRMVIRSDYIIKCNFHTLLHKAPLKTNRWLDFICCLQTGIVCFESFIHSSISQNSALNDQLLTCRLSLH